MWGGSRSAGGSKNRVLIEVTDGRNREVRCIAEAAGVEVVKLKRTRVGSYRMPFSMKARPRAIGHPSGVHRVSIGCPSGVHRVSIVCPSGVHLFGCFLLHALLHEGVATTCDLLL